ncbi:MAG TPA: DUF1206 domain-containing protein [Acidimicrobiales bacterium]|nr:DUF1206 domain-containing protein [Acidimicrobiales bacterium]
MAPVARIGLSSRAVVYALLAALAFLIATRGRAPASASGQGALAELARQPGGKGMLALLAAGLFAYALWRLLQAVLGIEPASRERPSAWIRIGWGAVAVVYLALFVEAVRLAAGGSAEGGPSNHPQPYAARILAWPGGTGLAGLIGTALVVAGVAVCIWAVVHDYGETFRRPSMARGTLALARVTGIAGNLTRGVLVVLVGVYLLLAAVADQPSKVKSLDQLLETGSRQAYGPFLVGLAAAGLAAYAVFSALEAARRRV